MNKIYPEAWPEFTHENGVVFVYCYTPLCGTCQLAGKMLEVVQEAFPTLRIYKCNLNYFPNKAEQYLIESVPCLLIWQSGKIQEKIYAFQSVQNLFDIVKRYHL
ncbi:thioredoxin family protein [Schinkia sp. CFF1]